MSTDQLKQAYELIKAGHKTQAMDILIPILKTDKSNVNAWWLLAHAAPKLEQVEMALQNVLKLQPDHAQARAKLEKMKPPPPAKQNDWSAFPDADDFVPLKSPELSSVPPVWSSAPSFGYTQKKASTVHPAIWLALVAAVVVVAICIILALVVSPLLKGGTPPDLIAGWQRIEGRNVELQLPPNYRDFNMSDQDMQALVAEMRRLGPEFSTMADELAKHPDAIVLWTYDVNSPANFMTNVNVAKENVGVFTSLEANVESALRSLPPQYQVVERRTVQLTNYKAERLVLHLDVYGIQTRQLAYIIKKWGTVYTVTYTTSAGEFNQRLPVFEQSIKTFFIH